MHATMIRSRRRWFDICIKTEIRRLCFGRYLFPIGAPVAALVLVAFEDNIVFFYSPSDLKEKSLRPGQTVRLGGLVVSGSVKKAADDVTTIFSVTDLNQAVQIRFTGLLPDLFREGQGIVSEGTLGPDGVFTASSVLAKHDENYMPKEIAGYCRETGQKEPSSPGEFVRCILESLALLYRKRIQDLSELTGKTFSRLHVIGGGSRNELLNQFTADALGMPVIAAFLHGGASEGGTAADPAASFAQSSSPPLAGDNPKAPSTQHASR